MSAPKTLKQAIVYYNDFEDCREFMMNVRWPDGVVRCPECDSDKVSYIAKERVWRCHSKHPKRKFSLKTGTIFEDSPLSLEKWLPVMWMLVNSKNGISSWEIHRALGVTQKTAWFMLQRGRLAMQSGISKKLSGHVEVDETFIGGKARNMHASKRAEKIQGRGTTGKTIVLGMLQRGGKVKASVVEDREKATLQPIVNEGVLKGTHVYTDELISYWVWKRSTFIRSSTTRKNTSGATSTPTAWKTSGVC